MPALDKGAARSKKRAEQLEKAAQRALEEQALARQAAKAAKSKSKSKSASNQPSAEAGPSKPRPEKKKRLLPEEQSRDPELYKPKAIRSATALVWPCDLPPASLDGITRVDLTNSGVTDVEWLRGSQVRWLSLSGCGIADWSPVGSLRELTVLNVNECGLRRLPDCLKGLANLKALVAMSNPWKVIDEDVINSWTELNSLIISHSTNLTSIPNISTLVHLSKLTFSHCPRITPGSIPDLSALPLLRDVKMNNLPLLTALPPHILSWGTGSMSSLDPDDSRSGLGLESLDFGSCSLEEKTLATFKSARMANLRSLTLHHNPLCSAKTDYVALIQSYGSMPRLQIVDNKRVVEKKKHEPVAKSKKNKSREKRGKPTGTNDVVSQEVKMRSWGNGTDGADAKEDGQDGRAGGKKGYADRIMDGPKDKKRKRIDPDADGDGHPAPASSRPKDEQPANGSTKPKKKAKHVAVESVMPVSKTSGPSQAAPPSAAKVADPSALTTDKAHRHSQNETGVYGVVEVAQSDDKLGKAAKGKKDKKKGPGQDMDKGGAGSGGGIDLKSIFSKSEDTGLGVGGW